MWTAFGIMIGTVMSLAFYNVTSTHVHGLNWRLMLGSVSISQSLITLLILTCTSL